MKKVIAVFLWVLMSVEFSGCATTTSSLQRKFTRKPKEKPKQAVMFFDEGPYQKQYSNEYYYKTHYTYWRTWHDTAIDELGGNSKKMARSLQESYGNLNEMANYVQEPHASELRSIANQVGRVLSQFETTSVTDSQMGAIRIELERIQRAVAGGYTHSKMKAFLIPDSVSLDVSDKSVEDAAKSANNIQIPQTA